MELDQWKHQLNDELSTSATDLSLQQISHLLHQRAGSLVHKVERGLRIELSISVFFTLCCMAAALLLNTWAYRMLFSGFALAGTILSVATAVLAVRTHRVSVATASVKQNLESVISIITQYTRLYLRTGIALFPVCFLLGFWLSYNDPAAGTKPIRWDLFGWMLLVVFAAATISYNVTRCYLKKLYGNHLAQLRAILKDLAD